MRTACATMPQDSCSVVLAILGAHVWQTPNPASPSKPQVCSPKKDSSGEDAKEERVPRNLNPTGTTMPEPPKYREIRAVYNEETIRVYQAYNQEIADAAVQANSFRGPLEAGIWKDTRMTWIKPSKVWMAYRCGWTLLKKDKNQARVLALDVSRPRFEELLSSNAVLSHGNNNNQKKACRDSPVVVQWDPERIMACNGPEDTTTSMYTRPLPDVRSIQIGLRGEGTRTLLDQKFVVKITDVTQDFQTALAALQRGDMRHAEEALWPRGQTEHVMPVSDALMATLEMCRRTRKRAVVVLGSAANPPHPGHLHCLRMGSQTANELGYEVLWSTIAVAPYGYVRQKMIPAKARKTPGDADKDSASPLVLTDEATQVVEAFGRLPEGWWFRLGRDRYCRHTGSVGPPATAEISVPRPLLRK